MCASNLRQLKLAWDLYVGNSGGPTPPYNEYQGKKWPQFLLEYHGNDKTMRYCPSAQMPDPARRGDGLGWGTVEHAWEIRSVWWNDQGLYGGSYGYNQWLSTHRVHPFSINREFKTISEIARPTLTPIFADSMWLGTWPLATDGSQGFNGYFGNLTSSGSTYMHRYMIARHAFSPKDRQAVDVPGGTKIGGAVNMIYVDGHVSLVQIPRLWEQHWHKDYIPPNNPPFPY